jgi:hypothetical protein
VCYPIVADIYLPNHLFDRLNSCLDAIRAIDINPMTSTGQIVKAMEKMTPTTASHQIRLIKAQIPFRIARSPMAESRVYERVFVKLVRLFIK